MNQSQIFKNYKEKHANVVQIGSNDGVLGEEYGFYEFLESLESFNLYLVEPLENYFQLLPDVYDRLKSEKKKITYCNYAISDVDGFKQMVDNKGESFIADFGDVTVVSKTWSTFISENNIDNIDILLLDCEGYEPFIFSSIDFEKIAIKNIRFEYHNIVNISPVYDFLVSKKYKLQYCEADSPHNIIAIHEKGVEI